MRVAGRMRGEMEGSYGGADSMRPEEVERRGEAPLCLGHARG